MDLNESWPPSEMLSGHLACSSGKSWTESQPSRQLPGAQAAAPSPLKACWVHTANPVCTHEVCLLSRDLDLWDAHHLVKKKKKSTTSVPPERQAFVVL